MSFLYSTFSTESPASFSISFVVALAEPSVISSASTSTVGYLELNWWSYDTEVQVWDLLNAQCFTSRSHVNLSVCNCNSRIWIPSCFWQFYAFLFTYGYDLCSVFQIHWFENHISGCWWPRDWFTQWSYMILMRSDALGFLSLSALRRWRQSYS